jgi:glycosyltransferase involved in cell wall biosynthesis
MSKRVLFIAYLFPPVGGAGVQRAAKFVKYLPVCGWTPTVLTVTNPSVPVLDESLVDEIPPEAVIRRAPTWEPSYAVKNIVASADSADSRPLRQAGRLARRLLNSVVKTLLQPDPQVLWLPGALREGLKLLGQARHEVILATAPPFSSFLVAARLSRKTGLPLVLDYRDEWTICNSHWENRRPDPVSRFILDRLQARMLRRTNTVLATTRSSAKMLARLCQAAGSKARVGYIYNGFDVDDFPAVGSGSPGHYPVPSSHLRLVYVGSLWNMASVEPLVQAVQRFADQTPDLACHLELVFAGRRTDKQQQHVEILKRLPCRVVEYSYLDHRRAVELLCSASLSCILLGDLPGAERVVPAKVFECMAARRPLLAITPPGEMTELLSAYPGAHVYHPRETKPLADFLANQVRRCRAGVPPADVVWDGAPFSRAQEARQLAEILDSCAVDSNSTPHGAPHEQSKTGKIPRPARGRGMSSRVQTHNANSCPSL